MTRYEFLAKLKEALAAELDEQAVQEHVEYYSTYIADALAMGESEEAVLDELGDPWVIARSVISVEETASGGQNTYEGYETIKRKNSDYNQQKNTKVYAYGLNTWWKVLLLVLGIIGVVALVLAVVGGIIAVLAPIVVPVLAAIFIIRLIKGKR